MPIGLGRSQGPPPVWDCRFDALKPARAGVAAEGSSDRQSVLAVPDGGRVWGKRRGRDGKHGVHSTTMGFTVCLVSGPHGPFFLPSPVVTGSVFSRSDEKTEGPGLFICSCFSVLDLMSGTSFTSFIQPKLAQLAPRRRRRKQPRTPVNQHRRLAHIEMVRAEAHIDVLTSQCSDPSMVYLCFAC